MPPFKSFFTSKNASRKISVKMNQESIYDIKIKTLQGDIIELSQFKGKYLLFVNVASKCGFTPQYKDLQELHDKYKSKLQIIGVPCNQFGGQEPGDAISIESFCEINYGISFLILEKTEVKGEGQHPLYTWLTKKTKNGIKNSSVKWNFQKYLVGPKGNLIDYYFSTTNPLNPKITKHLN